jgi:hypothetical protein
MTKLTLLCAAAAVVSVTLAGPAFAAHRVSQPAAAFAATQGDWCPGREPGNPYTKEEDYMAWSAWRARGGWDDRNDFNCAPVHPYHYGTAF